MSEIRNVVVIGSGPSGCAAALDAERYLAALADGDVTKTIVGAKPEAALERDLADFIS
ncbi:hypothetical protein ACFXKG_07080 [Streptomyces sp. NPDC059255]|uniref:hypothetical protein n=1 Tax=Streptomyces sp. NPDC059255 TaxID=3346793 RepID=UPI0036C6ABA6